MLVIGDAVNLLFLTFVIYWIMSPERASKNHFTDAADPELMQKLMESFDKNNWQFRQYDVDSENLFVMEFVNPSAKRKFIYYDYKGDPGVNHIEIEFWNQDKLGFVFKQIATKTKIENHIFSGPFDDKRYNGIHYTPKGRMEPIDDIKGRPKWIDTDATAAAFIEQVIEGKFGTPRLV